MSDTTWTALYWAIAIGAWFPLWAPSLAAVWLTAVLVRARARRPHRLRRRLIEQRRAELHAARAADQRAINQHDAATAEARIDTRPGADHQALETCEHIWNQPARRTP